MGFCMIPAAVENDCFAHIGGNKTSLDAEGPTTVLTIGGPKRIDKVSRGDALETLAYGENSLEWVGATILSRNDILDMPYLAPVEIKAGSLAPGLPTSDLLVTQQQRLFVNSTLASEYFGSYEALVPAVELLNIPGVTIAQDYAEVTYIHVLFHTQEFIWVNGVLTEILNSDQNKLQDKSPEARRELASLFPEALDPQYM